MLNCIFLTLNILRPGQNGRHFPDDILKCIFLNECFSNIMWNSVLWLTPIRQIKSSVIISQINNGRRFLHTHIPMKTRNISIGSYFVFQLISSWNIVNQHRCGSTGAESIPARQKKDVALVYQYVVHKWKQYVSSADAFCLSVNYE